MFVEQALHEEVIIQLSDEGTPILHLNAFNRILCDLLALEVKLEEEDKTLLLLSSLP